MIGTAWNMIEGSIYLLGTVYFWVVDKHWLPFVMIGYVMQCWVTLSIWYMPESPKYLLASRQFEELAKVVTRIAQFNKQSLN